MTDSKKEEFEFTAAHITTSMSYNISAFELREFFNNVGILIEVARAAIQEAENKCL